MSNDFCNPKSISEKQGNTSLGLSYFYAGIEKCPPNHYWLGIRDHYVIHFVLDGKGICKYSDDVYELSKGQCFLIRPNQKVYYQADGVFPWKYCWIAFSGIQASSLIEKTDFYNGSCVTGFTDLKDVENTIIQHTKIETIHSKRYLLGVSYLLRIFSHINIKPLPEDNTHGIKGRHLEIAINFIDRNYSTHIKVEDIAYHTGVDRKYLNSLFKQLMNVTTQQYLLNKRMEQATILLNNKQLSIKEVAHSVGYYDALLFSKMFKNKYGVSPKGFRNRIS